VIITLKINTNGPK